MKMPHLVVSTTRHGSARASPPARRVFCSSATTRPSSNSGLSLRMSALLGGFSGIASALTGTGGGIILIPALAKLTSMSQQTINGTQHGAITFTALLGATNHLQTGACNLPLAVLATTPSIVCARLGAQIAQRISSKSLSLAVGVAMLATAPLVLLKDSQHFPKFSGHPDRLDLQLYDRAHGADFLNAAMQDLPRFIQANFKYAVVGGLAGFVSGLVGVGGGVLVTAYLTAATDMSQKSIIGTSLLSIVPTSGSAAYTGFRAKAIHVPTALRMGGTLGMGVYLTSKYVTHDVSEEILREILATTVGAAALVMMRRGL